MIRDPVRRGAALAAFHRAVSPRLYADLEESGALPAGAAAVARREWECFALYACVRGLVAAGGFNRETAAAIDGMHDAVLEAWAGETDAGEPRDVRRGRIAARYAEYGAIGQEGGAAGAASVTARLGEACARHIAGDSASAALAETLGALHESLADGAAEAVRLAEDP